jgi:hypothetical protein
MLLSADAIILTPGGGGKNCATILSLPSKGLGSSPFNPALKMRGVFSRHVATGFRHSPAILSGQTKN